jgi:hypothetical protein
VKHKELIVSRYSIIPRQQLSVGFWWQMRGSGSPRWPTIWATNTHMSGKYRWQTTAGPPVGTQCNPSFTLVAHSGTYFHIHRFATRGCHRWPTDSATGAGSPIFAVWVCIRYVSVRNKQLQFIDSAILFSSHMS